MFRDVMTNFFGIIFMFTVNIKIFVIKNLGFCGIEWKKFGKLEKFLRFFIDKNVFEKFSLTPIK